MIKRENDMHTTYQIKYETIMIKTFFVDILCIGFRINFLNMTILVGILSLTF